METAFPRVVIWDTSKGHHIAIVHMAVSKAVTVLCSDCGTDYVFPDFLMPGYLEVIRQDPETQVMSWVQHNG